MKDKNASGSNVYSSRYPYGEDEIGTGGNPAIGEWPGDSKIHYAENHPCGKKGDPCKCVAAEVRNMPKISYYYLPSLVCSERAGNSNTFAAALYRRCISDENEVTVPGAGKKRNVFRRGSVGSGIGFGDRMGDRYPHVRPNY